ncbi:MAG: DUF362 domain-containing protein [Candidatus Omnitrophica bacterium]|nr:DUF362 domain-containing protein [Candidatus Omnitrophota bacterium]
MKSTVYLIRCRSKDPDFIGSCLKRLINKAYDFDRLKQNALIPIKLTVGEKGSRAHLHWKVLCPLVNKIKSKGAKPFFTDTNVIYGGKRRNAYDHTVLAHERGYSLEGAGAPFIVADGLLGASSQSIEVNFQHVKTIKVPPFIGIIEDLFVVSHVTGHMLSGFAASIKNVAMGLATRPGKQMQHSSVKPVITPDRCVLCGCCIAVCPEGAISAQGSSAVIDMERCIGCAECIPACKYYAIEVQWEVDKRVFARRMCEYARGILSRISNTFFINCIFHITKECDCLSKTDETIVDDIGIVAGDDILAVDKAAFDLVCAAAGKDVFQETQRVETHNDLFRYAEQIGLGSLEYEIVEVG